MCKKEARGEEEEERFVYKPFKFCGIFGIYPRPFRHLVSPSHLHRQPNSLRRAADAENSRTETRSA